MITKFIHHISLVITMMMCLIYNLFAQQEVLRPLKFNHQLRLYNANNIGTAAKMQSISDTLPIPFIDDFSSTLVYPDSSKWLDKNVFINSNFPINPPSVGVATFDGLNSSGNAYDTTNASATGGCDTLTSKPINLHDDGQGNLYPFGNDSIWLTFFVERKGRGNSVEANDSLVLQFYDKDFLTWTQIWGKTGGVQDTAFSKIEIPITDLKWFDNGFQFRFINYGSTSGSLDHWHLDYVFLQQNNPGFDHNIPDVAWKYNINSLLKEYTSIPWDHYKNLSVAQKIDLTRDTTNLLLSNISNIVTQKSISHQTYDENGNNIIGTTGSNTNNIDSFATIVESYNQYGTSSFYFPDTVPASGPSAEFTIVSSAFAGINFVSSNDTVRFTQKFKSYYSYDDGSAEAGYTITNTANAKVAMRFDLKQADTIRAVQIFFTQQYDNSTAYPFRLAIWDVAGGIPGNLVYQRASLTPDYVDSINGFATYSIPDEILILSGSVFIGTILNLASDYDIGFDANTNNKTHMYYNSTGAWVQTQFNGTFMIRPIFGDSTIFAGINEPEKNSSVSLYPNPSHDKVNIVSSNQNEVFNAEFFDCTGRLILKQTIENGTADISTLQKGFYAVRLTSKEKQHIYIKKLVVN